MTTSTARDQPVWQGSFNLADVGGLPFGMAEPPGRGDYFARAAQTARTSDGWRCSRSGITTVIDLRKSGENAPKRRHRSSR
jgi:hypothetical protein